MKARTDLSLTDVPPGAKRTRQAQRSEKAGTSWEKRITRQEKQCAVRLGVQAANRNSAEDEARAARVEALRAQVKAGSYQIDSRLLAGNILFPDGDMRDESPGN